MWKISILLSSILLSSCMSQKEVLIEKNPYIKQESISDLSEVSQDVGFYTSRVSMSPLTATKSEFEKHYFSVWNKDRVQVSLKKARWAEDFCATKRCFGANLQPIEKSFLLETVVNSNYNQFATLNKTALTLKRVDLRALPSEKPIFLDPSKAGEGFPFDYLQNSTIAPNKPLFVSHYSKDRAWVFVESSFAYGWVKSSDIAFIDKKYTKKWQQTEQIFIIKDRVALYNRKDQYLFSTQIGMVLPLIKENKESYTLLTVGKDKNSQALFFQTEISKTAAHRGKLQFTKENIDLIISEIIKSKYGWGGLYGERDCSSSIRDFYTPFGVWLPRNSYQQKLAGESISLEGITDAEKIEIITKEAIPFKTILYRKGHIVLYVGSIDKKPIVFQNMWGVKTRENGKEGRFIVGKALFSTLNIGSNLKNFDQNSSLLHQLSSMTKL